MSTIQTLEAGTTTHINIIHIKVTAYHERPGLINNDHISLHQLKRHNQKQTV